MTPIETEHAVRERSASVVSQRSDDSDRRFANLRSVRWRVNLGILPSFSSSIDDLRRVTADSRRRYAALRRRLLTDPHAPKNRSNSLDFSIDNPLSQSPDSTWGCFFRNAELEKTLDQDLSRLYPEHESYFQATGCQGMLRRVLLLWCLTHPECGYRQGMHELLAPFLYVLHIDVEYLSQIRKDYQEHFSDRFDGLSFGESDVAYNFDFRKGLDSMYDEIGSQVNSKKVKSLEELEPGIQTLVMLSDAYGAEGELGIVLSEKFVEHDAYCMFDALMGGVHASVALTDFFAYSPVVGSCTGLLPIHEASAALYQLLSIVDSSLHSHLVELGVEPQYFAIRWLRVLFGREFCLQDLLVVWDEIFSADNSQKLDKGDEANFRILNSPRGALISGLAVSMILHLRSSLLAAENATSCLQRLLNFPKNFDLSKMIEKANLLKVLAMNLGSDVCSSPSMNGIYHLSSPMPMRCNSLQSGSLSPKSPSVVVTQSYWEEKWRVMHEAEEEQRRSSSVIQTPRQTKLGWSRVKLRLFRAESEPLPSKSGNGRKVAMPSSVRRNLLEDFNRHLQSDSEEGKKNDNSLVSVEGSEVMKNENNFEESKEDKKIEFCKEISSVAEESVIRGNTTSEENSSIFSDQTLGDLNCHENDSGSSIGSNSFHDDNVDAQTTRIDSHLSVPSSESPEPKSEKTDAVEEPAPVAKERKLLSGKFQWFWKFGHDEMSDKVRNNLETANLTDGGNSKSSPTCSSVVDSPKISISDSKGNMDQNAMGNLRNLGHSMLEQIQVIESVFQQEQCPAGLLENFSKPGLVEKGQVTAMTALKELRKISNLLSEEFEPNPTNGLVN